MECPEKPRHDDCDGCEHVGVHEIIDSECSEICISSNSPNCVPAKDFIKGDEFKI